MERNLTASSKSNRLFCSYIAVTLSVPSSCDCRASRKIRTSAALSATSDTGLRSATSSDVSPQKSSAFISAPALRRCLRMRRSRRQAARCSGVWSSRLPRLGFACLDRRHMTTGAHSQARIGLLSSRLNRQCFRHIQPPVGLVRRGGDLLLPICGGPSCRLVPGCSASQWTARLCGHLLVGAAHDAEKEQLVGG